MNKVSFYDVKARAKVEVDSTDANLSKRTYTRTTKNGFTQIRYAMQLTVDGRKLTKFINEATYNALDVPVKQ